MKRRVFLVAAAYAPLAALAQQGALPVVGFLSSRSLPETTPQVVGFRQGLAEAGYVEGRNVTIEYRWAAGAYERLPALAAELVARRVAVIATAGGSPSALAAKAATTTIPIVFNSGGDLVKLGLVSSFGRPLGNMTGISQFAVLLAPKRLELLRELRPKSVTIVMLGNSKNPNIDLELAQMQDASRSLGMKLSMVTASSEEELDAALRTMTLRRADGLFVSADAFIDDRRKKIVGFAARQAIPAIYPWPDYVLDGGLMSYGSDPVEAYRQGGVYTGRILKGAKPEELPVVQPTKLLLTINLRTAKALALAIPQSILVRADRVIE